MCKNTPKTDACKKLSGINKAVHGEFDTIDDSHREVAWIFAEAADYSGPRISDQAIR